MTIPTELAGYPVFERQFDVAGRRWRILGPANFESLIDDPRVQERFYRDNEEFMPYWAEFWPASLVLAEAVAVWPPVDRDPRPTVLELGCGLGLISLIAASRGYAVIASDYDDDALAFVRANAELNGVTGVATRYVDWREHYPDLQLDRIIAAEVTYERRNLAPLAAFIRGHLKPGGEALLVDRNRQVADGFPDVGRRAGLEVAVETATVAAGSDEPIAARFFLARPG
jgi:SAM-dependent methyltransferase